MSALLLVVIVLLLPPLVRATSAALRAPESPSSFRLNRAFDMPESKWHVTPAPAESLGAVVPRVDTSAPVNSFRLLDVELVPDHQTHRSPDPFRGPPAFQIS